MLLRRPLFRSCSAIASVVQSCAVCTHLTFQYIVIIGHVDATCRSYRVGSVDVGCADALLCTAICVLWHKVGIQQQLCHGESAVHITLPSQNSAAMPRQRPTELPAQLPQDTPQSCRCSTLFSYP